MQFLLWLFLWASAFMFGALGVFGIQSMAEDFRKKMWDCFIISMMLLFMASTGLICTIAIIYKLLIS